MGNVSRRTFGKLVAGIGAAAVSAPALAASRPRVAVVGGGIGGAGAAHRLAGHGIDVVLVEANPVYAAMFASNRFLSGILERREIEFGYEALKADPRIDVVQARAAKVDGKGRKVTLEDGSEIPFERAVVAPGISFRFAAIEGHGPEHVGVFPHAYRFGAEVAELRNRLLAMEDGGTVLIAPPKRPYRCTPAPYERASMVALYLKRNKPKSKVVILDAKEEFPLMDRMMPVWERFYGDMIEWNSADFGGTIASVDPKSGAVSTDDGEFRFDIANIIPPQKAGRLAEDSDLTDESGWCPIDPMTMESRLVPGVHVIGDAIEPGDMSKSGHAANSQAGVCANAIAAIFAGNPPPEPAFDNVCYFLVTDDHALKVGGAYEARGEAIEGVSGYSSQPGEDDDIRRRVSEDAATWYRAMTRSVFE